MTQPFDQEPNPDERPQPADTSGNAARRNDAILKAEAGTHARPEDQ